MSVPAIVTNPDSSASVNAAGPAPSSSAACRTTLTLVESSAAATHSRVCAAVDSRRLRSRKTRCTPSVSGRSAGNGSRPASWAGVSEPGSSTSASGFPPVCAISRSRTSIGDRHTGPVGEQRGRGGRVEAAEHQLGQLAAVEPADVTVAGGEQQRNPFRPEPAGHEKQCRGGSFVQPVGVIDDAQHRCLLGCLRQQAQRGQEDQEPVTRPRYRFPRTPPAGLSPARAGSRSTCRITGRSSRCNAAKGNGDSTRCPGSAGSACRLAIRSGAVHQVGQQRRLADTRLPADHQRTTPGAAGVVQQAARRSRSRSRPCSTPAA